MRVVSEATVEEEGLEMGEVGEGRRDVGACGVARGKCSVIGEGAEGEGDHVVDVVLVGHALNAMPPTAAHVRDVGGPSVACGSHDVVHGLLFAGIGSGAVLPHGEPGLRAVY